MPTSDHSSVTAEYKRGLELAHAGDYFAAHESFELAWRSAVTEERDFFQGLVHAVSSRTSPAGGAWSEPKGRPRPAG